MRRNSGYIDQKSRSYATKIESKERGSAATSATLFLRASPSGPARQRQEALRERFESVRDEGRLDAARVERWPRTVTAPVDDEASADALRRYEALAEAVDEAGGRLEPFFRRRPRAEGLLVGPRRGEVVTFPVCCLVVSREEEVTGLYPCWLEGTHHGLEDGLAALEAGDPENLRAARGVA